MQTLFKILDGRVRLFLSQGGAVMNSDFRVMTMPAVDALAGRKPYTRQTERFGKCCFSTSYRGPTLAKVMASPCSAVRHVHFQVIELSL